MYCLRYLLQAVSVEGVLGIFSKDAGKCTDDEIGPLGDEVVKRFLLQQNEGGWC